MRNTILFLMLAVLSLTSVYAQTADSLPAHDSMAVNSHPARTDSLHVDSAAVIANSLAVDLIMRSQTEDMTSSVKESILREQLESLGDRDIRQRRIVLKQLEELYQSDSIRRIEQQARIDSLKQHAIGAPVVLKSDTIYYIYTNLGSFTAIERARLNSDKILKVAKQFSMKSDSLRVVDGANGTSDIMYKETILASITDTDGLWMEKTREELTEDYKGRILEAIAVYKKNIGILNILKTIGLCLLVLGGLFISVKGVSYGFRNIIDKKLTAKKDKWFKGFRIRNLELLDSDKELKAILFLSKMVRYLLYIILFYVSILLMFSIFPPTQRLAETLFGWIWSPISAMMKGFVRYLPNLFKILIIVVIIRYIIKLCRYVAGELASEKLVIPGFYPDWAKATFNIIRIFLYAFMLVLIFPYLPGSDSGVFQGVSVFIGVLFTLGSTSVIGNLMAGMVITYMRPFRIGDRIRIGDVFGDVIEKSPFVIRVKTHKNEIVTVPNSTVLSSSVINYSSTSADEGLIVNTTVTMGYDTPWRRVNELLIEAALKTQFIIDKPQPFVLQTALNDFSASYQLCAYTKNPEKQSAIYSQLHQNIQDTFTAAGIEMTVLHHQAIRDGSSSASSAANSSSGHTPSSGGENNGEKKSAK